MFWGQPWPFSKTGIEGRIWISGRRKERWGERVRHDRWRLIWNQVHFFSPRAQWFFQCTLNLFTLDSDTNPFICLFLHRNRYLCIFYKHSGHLSMAAHRWDRLPLSLACLAQGTRWPAKRYAKPATDRAQLDLNPFNSRRCLVHTNRKWLAPSKGVNPYLDHAVVVSPTLDGLANPLTNLDQSVSCGAHVNLINWPPMTPWGPQEYGSMAMITQVAWRSPAVTSCSTGIIELFSWN